MECHWVIETHKILVLNVGDCWVANKIMLGNVFNLYRSGESGHFVFGTIDSIGSDSLIHIFLRSIDLFLFIRSHHLLHHALQVNVNTAHVLAFDSQTLFSSHSLKYTQLVFSALNFFVLGNRLTHWRHHNNAVFVQQGVLCPIPDDCI